MALDLVSIIDLIGESSTLAVGGLAVGVMFGAFAQRSRFCLRAATIEFGHGIIGSKVAVWVLVFSAAVAATQAAIWLGWLDVSEARQLAAQGSLSGAILGGLIFGIGMILARGCASRLLVLSATGNLRAFVAGLILTVVAQASLRGALSPSREFLGSLWTIEGGEARDLLAISHASVSIGVLLGFSWLAIGVWLARRNNVSKSVVFSAAGVGAAIAAGWIFTYSMSQVSFDPVSIKSVSFTGPSADTLMGLINSPTLPIGFDVGLVPGVFLGSLIASILGREFKLQRFNNDTGMVRYIVGASMMGFGGMLAGGCAVGAGVTGSAVFAVTAWIALASMWVGAIVTDYIIDNLPARKSQLARF